MINQVRGQHVFPTLEAAIDEVQRKLKERQAEKAARRAALMAVQDQDLPSEVVSLTQLQSRISQCSYTRPFY